MGIFFYFSKNFTATAAGSVVRPVVCEKCSTEFHYELARMGNGSAMAPYGLWPKAAQGRAEKAAEGFGQAACS